MAGEKTIINRETLIPLGSIAVVIVAALWVSNATHKVEIQLLNLNNRMGNIETTVKSIKESNSDRWTQSDMRRWAGMLASGNEDLNVPEPTD